MKAELRYTGVVHHGHDKWDANLHTFNHVREH